jgi:crotonobetainyl-CoA:carnitine CoA-transferase CaiB-like acyl-CoA transferase
MQPLDDILVLDFTTLLPGPLATLMLAEAGAQVIKIERPGGETMRAYEPRFDGESAMFAMLNRGKKSVVLDLKNKADRARLMPLVRRADVLVEQFRPGVMARLGLGAKALRRINPRLIYCSITGYGQTGPRAGEAGHDINYIASTGLLALQPGPSDRPNVPPALVADIGGGTLPAVINILLALRRRERTGKGATIDIAMADAMFTFAGHAMATGHITGQFPAAGGARLTGGSPRYQLYPTRDGKLVACGALEQKFWLAFAAAIGLAPQFIDDRRDPEAAKAAVATIIAGRTADDWRPVLAKADCCVTIVATLEEALRDPHFTGRGLFAHKVTGASGAAMPALPVPIDPTFRGAKKSKPLPTLGADNEIATAPRRASAAAAKRTARRPHAARRGATGRSGR